MRLTELLARSLASLFPPLFCIVDLGKNNCLMPAVGELMMSCQVHQGVEQARCARCSGRCRAGNADHWGRFVLAPAKARLVIFCDCVARESSN